MFPCPALRRHRRGQTTENKERLARALAALGKRAAVLRKSGQDKKGSVNRLNTRTEKKVSAGETTLFAKGSRKSSGNFDAVKRVDLDV